MFLPTVISGTSMTPDGAPSSGLEGRRLSPFNKNLFQLMPTRDPILSELICHMNEQVELVHQVH